MDPRDLEKLLVSRATEYRRIATRADMEFKCLTDEFDAEEKVSDVTDDGSETTIRLQGPLDSWFGTDVREIISDLDKAAPSRIRLLVESPGGYFSDGLALFNDLKARANDGVVIRTEARGVVASAAVLPYLAGSERLTSTGTQFMVHKPWVFHFAAGNEDEIKKAADRTINALSSATGTYRDVMMLQTGSEKLVVEDWLKDETWFQPDEAVEAGIATRVGESSAVEDEVAKALASRVLADFRLSRTNS